MHTLRHKMWLKRDKKSTSARQQRCCDAECKESLHFECSALDNPYRLGKQTPILDG